MKSAKVKIGIILGTLLVGWGVYFQPTPIDSHREEEPAVHKTDVIVNPENLHGSYTVLRIYDGDTLTVNMNGQDESIRFCGIDAPEMDQPGGEESRDYLRALIGSNPVYLGSIKRDRWGRIVSEVFVKTDTGFLLTNTYMIRQGYALNWERYSRNCQHASLYQVAEGEQRQTEITQGIPPWEWRRGAR
ncbi:thermonuclease family protein [Limnospira sp. Paracas R14]|uniref:thermonuclease family protein n=1 Tax=Limnospira sp. Paracas R14 TaxID=2981108 RepID=UPI0028F03D53